MKASLRSRNGTLQGLVASRPNGFCPGADCATLNSMDQILIALAGVMGAAGIMLTAAGAHSKPGVGLDSAGYLLVLHALAVIAGVLAARQGLILRPLGLIVVWGFIVGATLFAADVTLRAYVGTRLFPMAAPSGGMVMILSWIVLIPAALMAMRAG